MCFIHDDYDWIASVCEESAPVATAERRCGECDRTILPGETYHHIYQQECEYGDCKTCDACDCECPEGKCCACKEPNIGETFDFDYCHECHLFLEAVQAAEIEAGCSRYESRPALGMMVEEIGGSRHAMQDAKRYFKKALASHPQLKPHLGKLWNQMFGQMLG